MSDNYFIDKKELLDEIIKSKEIQKNHPNKKPAECMTPKMVSMLMLMVENLSQHRFFRNYSWLDDMKSDALVTLCQNGLKFDPERFDNPFAYYTMVIRRCFFTYNKKEWKQRDIKDELIEQSDTDLLPSYTRQFVEEPNQLDSDLDGTKKIPSSFNRRRKRDATSVLDEIAHEPETTIDDEFEDDTGFEDYEE